MIQAAIGKALLAPGGADSGAIGDDGSAGHDPARRPDANPDGEYLRYMPYVAQACRDSTPQ